MISQRCPKCDSSRIRRGYRPTSIFKKILFRFNLLCDNCNWEFVGFALPFQKSSRSNRSVKRRNEDIDNDNKEKIDQLQQDEKAATLKQENSTGKTRKKIKIRA